MANEKTPSESAAKAVDEKIEAARESMGDRMGRMKEKVGDVAESVKAKASQIREKIRETEWNDVMDDVTGYIRNNPGKSVAIALGVGFALGFLLRRKGED